MLLEQGTAPAILLKKGAVVFQFTRRYLETEDKATIDAALKAGAIKAGDDQAVKEDEETGVPVPAGYEGLKKPEIVAKAAEEGIEISPNQSKPEMLIAVAKLKAEKAAAGN